ncbi:MAG: hypothetical protein ACR5KW_02870 [Wolbachia sp.]
MENNIQAALMAPITILAEQYYNWIEEFLFCTDRKVALFIDKATCKERKTIINKLCKWYFKYNN